MRGGMDLQCEHRVELLKQTSQQSSTVDVVYSRCSCDSVAVITVSVVNCVADTISLVVVFAYTDSMNKKLVDSGMMRRLYETANAHVSLLGCIYQFIGSCMSHDEHFLIGEKINTIAQVANAINY